MLRLTRNNSDLLQVKVRAGAKRERVEQLAPGVYKVWVSPPPEHERANQRVVSLLAETLDVPKRTVQIVRGQHQPDKTVAIIDESAN